jgi:LacI family transcriptional regulator
MEPTTRRVTIADVARRAGVSTSAVSKVLRNARGVSPGMRERVRATMTELGYRPHAAARGMRGRTYTVGVLLDNIRNAFFADLLEGVTEELSDSEYTVLVGAAGFAPGDQARVAHAMVDRRMDGLILIAPGIPRDEVAATARHVPTVVIGHHDRGAEFDSVVDDDATGGGLVVDHLVALGHRRIAHVSALGNSAGGWARRPEVALTEGYREAMRRHGLAEHEQIVRVRFSEEFGHQAGLRLLTAGSRPTAILVGADVAALGVFRAAGELGLAIPDDVSLVGFNNTAVAALPPVQLTSVDQAGHAMGAAAARLLLERVEGRRTRAQLVSVSPQLVVRRTTARPPQA